MTLFNPAAERLFEVVDNFATRMEDGGRFKEATVANLQELADAIPTLNVTNDTELADLCKEIQRKLGGYNAIEVFRRLARIDSSVGWTAMIGAGAVAPADLAHTLSSALAAVALVLLAAVLLGGVVALADGSAEFTKAAGLELDLTARGMGVRCQRFSMLVDDGVVKSLNIEAPGKFEVSDAATLLAQAKSL